jgi:hypothetical protein
MQSVADYINKMKRKIENLQVLVELQQKIDGWEVPSLLWYLWVLLCRRISHSAIAGFDNLRCA